MRIVLILVVLFVHTVNAQEGITPPAQVSKAWGVNLSPYLFSDFGEDYYTLNLTKEYKKHVFSLGFIFPLGGHFEYMFFPNGTLNRFNLFFDYNAIYTEFVYVERLPPVYYPREFKKFLLIHSIGYGFRLNITPKFYLENSLNVGLINNLKRGPAEIAYILKLGVGYVFRNTEKGKISLLKD